MGGSLSLNGTWDLVSTERKSAQDYTGPAIEGKWILKARVPAPIHKVLMEHGLAGDPNVGLNALYSRWVEEGFWVYRHVFQAPPEAVEQHAWLTFQCLELDAIVWLNGEEVGRHANANRPAGFDVTGKLQPGENLLVVLIESGLYAAADKPAGEYGTGERDISRLTKRPFLRHAAYQHCWDWSPRLLNVGILGDVGLEWQRGPRLGQVTVYAIPEEDLSEATVHVRATVEGTGEEPVAATLRARIVQTGQEAALPFTIVPGEQRPEIRLVLKSPRRWWPNGHGAQELYTVAVALEAGGEMQSCVRTTGVRRVEIDQSPHPLEGRYFIIKVNGRPIFLKGGNWAVADVLYSTVEDERYRELVRLAAEANCNFFRVNGTGIYVTHALAEACDRAGILLWHDLPFGNCKYPGDDPDFAAEAHREVTWAVRELAHHPALILWCGNNEIEWMETMGPDEQYRVRPHHYMFHHDFPRIVGQEDRSALYRPSSPFSPDYRPPNDAVTGNQHPWGVSILTPGPADWWAYRKFVDRCAVEGGVIGAAAPGTLRQFLPENERYLFSPSWEYHDNPIACHGKTSGALGNAYATVELWTGREVATLGWEEYAYISALLQAEGLGEYAANYRRRMFSSSAAVFWSYNDAWPATHSWTIVDYYRRTRLAYHPIRRAFQPVTVVVAEEGEGITVYGVNDSPQEWAGELRYGLFALRGGLPVDQRRSVVLPANGSTPLEQIGRAEWEALDPKESGAFALLYRGASPMAQHRLFVERFKDLAFASPEIRMDLQGDRLTLAADVFCWGVCLDVEGDARLPDNCFDLLPGIPYEVPWTAELGEPRIVRVGSRDAVHPVH
jgi:beta-mannosidase